MPRFIHPVPDVVKIRSGFDHLAMRGRQAMQRSQLLEQNYCDLRHLAHVRRGEPVTAGKRNHDATPVGIEPRFCEADLAAGQVRDNSLANAGR